jgi:hypothetical protein
MAGMHELQDRARLERALQEIGLDPETIRLIADLSPRRGETALTISMCVATN